ncbi:hypothetical protein [Streptomyces rugosispiralis]|uniref:Uncharacterized protein n=1 Tax=Streptomyces rugosispiralis TaxID=2967341 RepID=A0ABT1UT29_9ACTN|nr:hypothetical protein [Streptomyces rugosispiralis]MCQ8187769.1 hypothetical protein [Streptomyces rugosispiralis]
MRSARFPLLLAVALASGRVRDHARRLAPAIVAALALVAVSSTPATAYAPVGVVHTERVKAGPYTVTVGFSEWPLRAMESLDFTFAPADGLAGKSGRLTLDGPGIDADDRETPLSRHPRKRDVWGLDVQALPEPGAWSLTFDIDGRAGHGRGTLPNVTVLDQPGPPLAISWTVCAIPLVGMLAYLAVGWRRNKPSERVAALV